MQNLPISNPEIPFSLKIRAVARGLANLSAEKKADLLIRAGVLKQSQRATAIKRLKAKEA